MDSQCQALTKKNLPCKNRAKPGSKCCGIHSYSETKNKNLPQTAIAKSRFINLPLDIQKEQAYFLTIDDLNAYCRSDVNFQKFCQDKDFQKTWAERVLKPLAKSGNSKSLKEVLGHANNFHDLNEYQRKAIAEGAAEGDQKIIFQKFEEYLTSDDLMIAAKILTQNLSAKSVETLSYILKASDINIVVLFLENPFSLRLTDNQPQTKTTKAHPWIEKLNLIILAAENAYRTPSEITRALSFVIYNVASHGNLQILENIFLMDSFYLQYNYREKAIHEAIEGAKRGLSKNLITKQQYDQILEFLNNLERD